MRNLLQLIYPRRCPLCDDILEFPRQAACPNCLRHVRFVSDDHCMTCGKQLSDNASEYCLDCESGRHVYDKGRMLWVYEDAVKESIYRFKYTGRKAYAQKYAQIIEQELGDFVEKCQADGIIPVPLHFYRQQKRGYNQAALIARALGKRYEIPVYDRLVSRVKNTKPQKRLDLLERQNNLKKAFKIRKNDVKLNTIILIDDIYTTGSTIDAISEVLRNAGVAHIYFVTLAGGVDRRGL